MENKDMRYENTTLKIFKAFQVLSLTKEMGEIYVNDICKEANITRQTFYRHYKDKYELFNDLVLRHIRKISFNNGVSTTINNPKAYIYNIMKNAINDSLEKKEFFKSVFRDSELLQIVVTNAENFSFKIYSELNKIYKMKYDIKYISCSTTGAILLLIYRWINDNPENTKERFLKELKNLISDIIDHDILTEKEDLIK